MNTKKSDYGDISNGSLYYSNATQPSFCLDIATPYINYDWSEYKDVYHYKKGGDDDMRYLYEVILVNPKNDEFYVMKVITRSETSALMEVYNKSNFCNIGICDPCIPFDDLKTSCRVLMEWKKEKSLKKAIETIKEAVK